MSYEVRIKWPKGIFDQYTLVVEPKIKSDTELLDFVQQNRQQDKATGVKYQYQTYKNGKPLTKAQFHNALERGAQQRS